MADWNIKADSEVRHVWQCPETGERYYIAPDFYEENGVPIEPEYGSDLVYLWTEIRG